MVEKEKIRTLSNAANASGNGIPMDVSATALKADFIRSFSESSLKSNETKVTRDHEIIDLYSTIVG